VEVNRFMTTGFYKHFLTTMVRIFFCDLGNEHANGQFRCRINLNDTSINLY